MEAAKQLRNRYREKIVALASRREEIQNMEARRRQIDNLSNAMKSN